MTKEYQKQNEPFGLFLFTLPFQHHFTIPCMWDRSFNCCCIIIAIQCRNIDHLLVFFLKKSLIALPSHSHTDSRMDKSQSRMPPLNVDSLETIEDIKKTISKLRDEQEHIFNTQNKIGTTTYPVATLVTVESVIILSVYSSTFVIQRNVFVMCMCMIQFRAIHGSKALIKYLNTVV